MANIDVSAPSTAGLKLDGGFTIPKQSYFVGEPHRGTFTVTNNGDTRVSFPTGGDYRGSGRHDRFSVHAVDEQEQPVPDPVAPNGMGGDLGGGNRIEPGASYTEKLLLNQWCAFSKPGKYRITCKRVLNVIRSESDSHIYTPESSLPSVPIETHAGCYAGR